MPVSRLMMQRETCKALPCFFEVMPAELNPVLASAPNNCPTLLSVEAGAAEGVRLPASESLNTKPITRMLAKMTAAFRNNFFCRLGIFISNANNNFTTAGPHAEQKNRRMAGTFAEKTNGHNHANKTLLTACT